MCTPVILADRSPLTAYDTPTSTHHVIIARAEFFVMPECYTLVEMELYQGQTMPPATSSRPVRLHAAVDGEDGEVTAACSYPVAPERDVPKRGLPFSAGWKTVVQRAPECPACAAAIKAAA